MFSSTSPNTLDESNDLQAAHNWFRCLKDLFNKFSAEFNQNRSNDSVVKRRTREIRADYLLQIDSLEQQIKNLDLVTLRNLLSINGACLRLCCFGDPWLEQKVVENEAAVEQLRDLMNEIDDLKRDDKWVESVKELVAPNLFAWGTQTIIEILEYDKNSDELVRLSEDDVGFLIKVINCIRSWPLFKPGYQIDKCQKICEVLVKVINKSYWPCIKNGDGRMSALENELAECAAKTLEDLLAQWDARSYPKAAIALLKLLLDSLSDITKAECKEGNKNEAIGVNIFTLISSTCERHYKLMLNGITTSDPEHSELFKRVVALILEGTTKPGAYPVDESYSKVVLDFWLCLAYQVHEELGWEEEQACIEEIKPLYVQLTNILLKKGKYPDENDAKRWTESDFGEFEFYRGRMKNFLCAVYDILQSSMLEILSCALDEGVAAMQNNPMSWTKLEVCIFFFSTIAVYVADSDPPVETDEVPKLMRTLAEIPYDKLNKKVFETALSAVNSHCHWFSNNPNYIPVAVQLLVKGLDSPFYCGISELCSECREFMMPYAEPLLDACINSISTGKIKGLDVEYPINDIATLMSMLPEEKIKKYLDIIINPYFEELKMICQAGEKSPKTKITVVFRLNLLSSLFKSLNTRVRGYWRNENEITSVQPVLLLCQENMPLFRQVAEFWKDDEEVVETVCFTLTGALTNLDEDFKPMLEEFCSFLISVYQRKPCSSVLYVSRECLRVFGLDEDTKQLKQQMLSQIVFYTFKLIEETPDDGFSKIVKMVEEFRDWMMHLIENRFELLLGINIDYSKLISYVLKILTEYKRSHVGCTTRFLEIFILNSRNIPDMTQAVLDQGKAIVRTAILYAACPDNGRDDVEKLADVLQALNNVYLADLTNWLKMLDASNFPTPLIVAEDKKKFAAQIVKPDSNKYHIRMHVREFAANCRGVERI